MENSNFAIRTSFYKYGYCGGKYELEETFKAIDYIENVVVCVKDASSFYHKEFISKLKDVIIANRIKKLIVIQEEKPCIFAQDITKMAERTIKTMELIKKEFNNFKIFLEKNRVELEERIINSY